MTERVTYTFDVFIVRDKFDRELYRVPYSVYQQMHELMTHPKAAHIIKRVRSLRTIQARKFLRGLGIARQSSFRKPPAVCTCRASPAATRCASEVNSCRWRRHRRAAAR